MAEELSALRESFVAEFILRDAAKCKAKSSDPELRHFSMHRRNVLVGVKVVVSITNRSILLRTF